MSPDELHDALEIIDRRRQAAGIDNDLRGDSDRNSILGEITDGARNLGIALGISSGSAAGKEGFVDANGNLHIRTFLLRDVNYKT